MIDEPDTSTIGGRAKAIRVERQRQQIEIATDLGISLRAWQKMERNEGTPSGETLVQFLKIGINPGWVLSGIGPKALDENEHNNALLTAPPSSQAPAALPSDQFVRVPIYDVKASLGHGALAVSQMPVGEVAFTIDFLRRLGANPQFCYLLEARGDSMWPTIPDGAMLIVDASQTEVDDGRIYHFDVNERVLVKRARWMEGRLHLTSDNMAAGYRPESFAADRVDELIVRGRVVFVGHAPMPVR